jgi:CHAT domain
MNDSFLASLVASSLFFALALYAMQRGWLRVPVQGGELQQLREQVDKLQILLDYAEEERDKTSRQLAKALRRVEALENREKELQAKIDALQVAIDNRINKVSVLGIWAGTGINVTAERDAVYNAGYEYRALFNEDVTRANILRELRTGSIAIIEVGAHGSPDAILANDLQLNAGWWQRVLKGRNVRVAVLLACFSDSSIADAMKRAGLDHVIAVTGEIEDMTAIEFAQQFYQLYAAGLDIPKAFDEAKLALDYRQAEKLVLR